MDKLEVQIKLDQRGQGTIHVNGEDWSKRVKSVQVASEAGERCLVTLTLWPTNVELLSPAEVLMVPVQENVAGDVVLLSRQSETAKRA